MACCHLTLRRSFSISNHLLQSFFFTNPLTATSRTRLGARDHYTLSALFGGKGGASPSLLHATLDGPTEYVNARWM